MTPGSTVQNFRAPASQVLTPASNSLSPVNYVFLQKFIYAESGIVIEDDKQYLLESRLLPIVRDNKLKSLDSLSQVLAGKSSPTIVRAVIDAMTTNETLFFRDPAMFDSLRSEVVPKLLQRKNALRKLRIWSAAASSGQEAYSLAMMLLEMGVGKSQVEILGTDLSSQVLDRARTARYVQFEVGRGLPSAYLTRYFSKVGLEWQLKDEVREMVRFEQKDLRQDLESMGKFDLILCRNVLIYFDVGTKKKIVAMIRKILAADAYLVLGCAETVINLHSDFQRVLLGLSTFYQV